MKGYFHLEKTIATISSNIICLFQTNIICFDANDEIALFMQIYAKVSITITRDGSCRIKETLEQS